MFRYPASLRTLHNIASFTSRKSLQQLYPHVYVNHPYSSSSLLLNTTTTANKSSTMQLIKKLRSATGAPMVECKKAISAQGVDGNYEKANEWLRKNGSAKAASKLAGRDASEGLVGIAISEGVGAIVRVSSETDFASRSPVFSSLVQTVADGAIILSRRSRHRSSSNDDVSPSSSSSVVDVMDVEDLLATTLVGGDDTESVKDVLDDAVLAIRENLQIANVTAIVPGRSDAVLAGYVHGKVGDGTTLAGTAAAIVELVPTNSKKTSSRSVEDIQEIGRKLAMHIVAAKPTYLSPDQIPDTVLEKEREILLEQMGTDSGKTKDILDKIVSGRMRKFYEQVCLMEQAHMVEDGNPKISKLMKTLGLEVVQFESNFV